MIAYTFSGKKIIGEYRQPRNTYGAYVYGLEWGKCEPPQLYICLTLNMEKLDATKLPKTAPPKLKYPDPCTGQTKSGIKVVGFFMNKEGKYSWIKGRPEGASRLTASLAYKVLTDTLARV